MRYFSHLSKTKHKLKLNAFAAQKITSAKKFLITIYKRNYFILLREYKNIK